MPYTKFNVVSRSSMLALALALATPSAPARAADLETWSVSVPVADLNLNSASGQAALRQRMINRVKSQYATQVIGQAANSAENRSLEKQAVERISAKEDQIIAAARQCARTVSREAYVARSAASVD